MKHILLGASLFFVFIVLYGCRYEKLDSKKVSDVDFTVMDMTQIPTELEEQIVEKRGREFTLVYKVDGEMYLCVGFGKQLTGGYSVKVKDVYITENTLCVDTTLIGPKENKLVLKACSYPCIVIKVENIDKKVVFL